MTLKTIWKCYAILALMGILFSAQTFAQEGKFQAAVFLIDVQTPIVIPDFTINGERFYDAVRQGKKVKLPFRDLKEIRFLNPAKSFEVEVLFNDGKKETVLLQPAADIVIDTGMLSEYSHSKVARIQFAPMPVQTPPLEAQPAPRQPRPEAVPVQAVSVQADRVVLRNGDSLSGKVQTKSFPLRTAYGTFRFDAAQIASIEFDATKPHLAMVLLKNGDRLSGTVEVESLSFTMTSGEAVSFDGKTIQTITFKK
jgi:hypothetical protein